MAYERQLEHFLGKNAVRVGDQTTPLQKLQTLQRMWGRVLDNDTATDRAFLDTYIDGDNTPAARSFVTDPTIKVGNAVVTVSGVFRLVGNQLAEGGQGWVQTLALGWATSIAWTEAFLVGGADESANDRILTIQWRNIAPASVKSCMDAIRGWSSPLSDIVVQGTTHSGKWAVGTITPNQTADGSYTITLKVTKVAQINGIADLQALTPTFKGYVQDVKNPFGVEGGYLQHIPRDSSYAIVYEYPAIDPASVTVLRNFTGGNWVSLLPTADAAKYEFGRFDIGERTDVATLKVAYPYIPLRSTVSEDDARYGERRLFNQSGVWKLQRRFPRINPANIKSLMESNAILIAETITDPKADGIKHEGVWIVNTTSAPNTSGEGVDIIQELTKSGDQFLHTYHYTDADHRVDTFKLVDGKAADVTAFLDETGTWAPATYNWRSAPAAGIERKVDWGFNQDGTAWLTAVIVTTSTVTTLTGGGALSLVESSTQSHSIERAYNIPAASIAALVTAYSAAAVVNVKRQYRLSPRKQDGTYDVEGEITSYAEQVTTQILVDDSEKTVTKTIGRFIIPSGSNDTTYFQQPVSPTAGTTVQISDRTPTEVGSVNVEKTTTVAKNQTSTSVRRTFGRTVTTVKQTASASEATIAAGEVSAGKSAEVQNAERPDGLKATAKATDVEVDIVTQSRKVSAAATVDTETHTASPTPLTPGTRQQGQVIEVINKTKENGASEASRSVAAEVDQASTEYRVTALGVTTVDRHSAAASALAQPSPSAGVEKIAKNSPTPGGNVTTELTTNTPTAWTGTRTLVEFNAIFKVYETQFRNQPATLPAELTASGLGQKVIDQVNALGLRDGVLREIVLSNPDGENLTQSTITFSDRVSATEPRARTMQRKIPKYSVSTNPSNTTQTGWNLWEWVLHSYRTVTRYTSMQYFLTLPSLASAGGATTAGPNGASQNWYRRTIPMQDGMLYAVETQFIETTGWSLPNIQQIPIATIALNEAIA